MDEKGTLSYDKDRRGFAPHPTRAVTALDPQLRMVVDSLSR